MKTATLILFILLQVKVYAQDFVFVFLNKKADKLELPEEEVKVIMDGHMANINRLAKEGKLLAAGPFDGGGGIFVFKSRSIDEVNEWLATDPGIKAKRWDIEAFPYLPSIGSICSVGEKYEMTNYFFVRYSRSGDVTKRIQDDHSTYVRKLKLEAIIAEGRLGDTGETILVLKEEPTTDWLSNDPASKSGSIKPILRKLFIAKGSFCEPK
jgi:uncharacterized protein YciI